MSDILPEEICYDILLQVPAKSLSRFRSVCKTWCRIIDDIAFIKLHLDKQQGGDHLIIQKHNTGMLYALPLSSVDSSENHTTTVEMTNINKFVHPGVPRIHYLPLPSNSGFILFGSRDESKSWALWNPFSQESFLLPPHGHFIGVHDFYNKCCGIGYDSVTDDFKVVRIVKYRVPGDSYNIVKTLIYSLKSNQWKIIPNLHDHMFFHDGVFVNGALHWITNITLKGQISQCIIAFDLSTEKGRKLPCPLDRFHSFTLDELGGYLSVRDSRALWIMKDYGENVWTKLVSLEQLSHVRRPIAYIERKGQIVFQQNSTELWLFDVEKKCAKRLRIGGVSAQGFTCQVFPTSLFRLNRSGGGDGSIAFKKTLRRKRQTANDRLEVELKISDVSF